MSTTREFINVLNKKSPKVQYKTQKQGDTYILYREIYHKEDTEKQFIACGCIWAIKKVVIDLLDNAY